jgi:hypothetical protein
MSSECLPDVRCVRHRSFLWRTYYIRGLYEIRVVGEGYHKILPSLVVVGVWDCSIDGTAICDWSRLVERNRIRPRAGRRIGNFCQHLVVHPIIFQGQHNGSKAVVGISLPEYTNMKQP